MIQPLQPFGPDRKIRLGVVGVGRGQSFMGPVTETLGIQLVALCDTWEERLVATGKKYNVATYTDFDRFLEHDLDAVVLANFFHEHAPFAIKALAAGKHVMSETSCNSTLAEGVALCRAVEQSGKVYMLAENYPYTVFNQELRRVYRSGEIGTVTYAEGEYNHPMSPNERTRLSPGENHWRNWLPSTYYCTHALAPLVYITEQEPVLVNAHSIACREVDAETVRRADPGSVILCRTAQGAVFRIFGLMLPGHSNYFRVHGARGAMEIERGGLHGFGSGRVRVWHEEFNRPADSYRERVYHPEWPEHGALASKAGHGGGDFWTSFHFAQAIRSGTQPFLDVYRGVAMSSVGILAWKSALENGAPYPVPDFRCEASRRVVQDDHWSPWPKDARPGQPPTSLLGCPEPTPEARAKARQIWDGMGYRGQ